MKKTLLLTCSTVFLVLRSVAQTIPVGTYAETVARRNQLLGFTDSTTSFCVRPLNGGLYGTDDAFLKRLTASKNLLPDLGLKIGSLNIPLEVKLLPFSYYNEYNFKRPYGYNNGTLYPNAGYQTRVTGGIYIKAGILNIQVKPEYVAAQNKAFSTFPIIWYATTNKQLLTAFFYKANAIDAPERFGYGHNYRLYPGQSKITLIYKGVEAGVSTENLWWGPAVQNSIMMSNSAPGFVHWTFNSAKPIETRVGAFQWQLIGGTLKQSGLAPYELGKWLSPDNDPTYYWPKPATDRYLSAFTFNWQPKWLTGFFVGASGYDYMNKGTAYQNKNFFKKYLAVFSSTSDQDNGGGVRPTNLDGDGQDYAYSVYFRQLLPKYNAELYAEFARNDRVNSFTDLATEPEHSLAYTMGLGKLFKIKDNQYIHLKMELTKLESPPTYQVRASPSWYVHTLDPRDGYTNLGRVIGAGIGPGSNSFLTDLSYVRNHNTFGIKFERLLHDNDTYYRAFSGSNYFNANWVDLNTTAYANVFYKGFLISAEATTINSLNYEYYHVDDSYIDHKQYYHVSLNLTYNFK